MKKYIITAICILNIFNVVVADQQPVKRSYVCPPNFMRLSHRCYFFSFSKSTWQDAYYQCTSMHSNLAIIKSHHQDKLIKKILSKKATAPHEWWLGGRFDWQKQQWKWAASGKPLTYKGFDKSSNQDESTLQWNCIIMDPALGYRWNSTSCLDQKHFICQKRIQTINNKQSRNHLLQKYNSKTLNEIPVPDLPAFRNTDNNLQNTKYGNDFSTLHFEIVPVLGAKEKRNKMKRVKKPKLHKRPKNNSTTYKPSSVTLNEQLRRRRFEGKKIDAHENDIKMYYKTYKEEGNKKHYLHPSPVVEEYEYKLVKSSLP